MAVVPPRLSRQQFLQRRPGGVYPNYLRAYKRQYGGTHGVPPNPPALPTYQTLLAGLKFDTPAQMEARAQRMTAQSLKGQQQMIAEDYRRQQADALRRMQAFAAAGNQAAAMNASLIGQVGSQYQAGADQLNAMAAGGAGMMAGATQADVSAANQALGNVGAPAVSIGGPVGAPGIAGDTQAGVESYRGGTLPAGAMQSAGGYAQAGMAGQISSQNLRATQEAEAAYMQAMGEAQANRQSAIKELALGRPEIAAKYLLQLQDNQRQQVALAMSLIGQRRAAMQSGFEQGMTKKQYAQSEKARQTARNQWYMQFKEDKRQFGKSLDQRKAEMQADANRYQAQLRASGKAVTPRQSMAQIVSSLGQNSYDADFQNFVATLFYTHPSLATSQPTPGNKDFKSRTHAVITYLLNTYWPSISTMIPAKQSGKQAQLKAEFEQQLRQWFSNMALPQLQAWKLAQVG